MSTVTEETWNEPIRSELTGRAVHLSGYGHYAGKEWPATIRQVFRKDLEISFGDPFGGGEVVLYYDRLTGFPHDDKFWRVDGFRLRTPEIQFLMREERGELTYPQFDAAQRGNLRMSDTATATAEAPASTAPAANKIIDLEGFGKNNGRIVQAEVVEQTDSQVLLAIPQDGKEPLKKTFMLDTGKMEGNVGANGWKISDAHLSDLTGKSAKKAATSNGGSPAAKKSKEPKFCLCGCGEQVNSRFKTGHDATAHSMIKKGLRGLLKPEDLKGRDWVLDQIEMQGGFNTQEAPPSARKASSGESFSMVNPATGKTLYGAAARALKDRIEAEKKETAGAPA